MRRGLTGKRQPSPEEESACVCGRYFGLSDRRLCPTLVFAGGCVSAIAGLAFTAVGAVGGAQTGFASNVAYLVLLVVGLVLVGAASRVSTSCEGLAHSSTSKRNALLNVCTTEQYSTELLH